MQQQSKRHESLREVGKRLREGMREAHTGQTRVAVEVARLSERWEVEYKAEAGGLELGPWLIKEVDPTIQLAAYVELAEAAKRAGTIWTRVESRGLRWMHRHIPEEPDFKAALTDVARAFKEQGAHPLKLSQVTRVCSRYSVPAKGRERLRDQVRMLKDRVGRLEAQIRSLGAEPVE